MGNAQPGQGGHYDGEPEQLSADCNQPQQPYNPAPTPANQQAAGAPTGPVLAVPQTGGCGAGGGVTQGRNYDLEAINGVNPTQFSRLQEPPPPPGTVQLNQNNGLVSYTPEQKKMYARMKGLDCKKGQRPYVPGNVPEGYPSSAAPVQNSSDPNSQNIPMNQNQYIPYSLNVDVNQNPAGPRGQELTFAQMQQRQLQELQMFQQQQTYQLQQQQLKQAQRHRDELEQHKENQLRLQYEQQLQFERDEEQRLLKQQLQIRAKYNQIPKGPSNQDYPTPNYIQSNSAQQYTVETTPTHVQQNGHYGQPHIQPTVAYGQQQIPYGQDVQYDHHVHGTVQNNIPHTLPTSVNVQVQRISPARLIHGQPL